MASYGSDTLATISQDGEVPECRMHDARQVQDFARRLIDNDSRRSYKRSRVNGLVDGNPPYKQSALRQAGRAEACNVNWGIARSYLESGSGAFYDLFQEAPGYLTVKTSFGNPEQKEEWSRIVSEEADRILRNDDVWDYEISLSIDNMVLHGCGPLMFENAHTVIPRGVLCGDLKVPEFTKSDTKYWDAGFVQMTYYPPELYEFIKNPEAAKAVGWDVEYTQRVIANAMDIRQQAGIQYEWEFYQQELKNNSLSFYDDSKICRLAFVYWKEFDGRVTQAIVERDTADGLEVKYLFLSVGRYASFKEAVHPMYFDKGNAGYHHSVTGLGVKMYSAMEYQNRLLCNLADKAFAPKILFKPTTTDGSQKFSLAHFGDYAVLPGGFDWQQTGVSGLMNEGLTMNHELTNVVSSNLSSYRQQVQPQTSGNPPTKYQKQLEASIQSALSKTQNNRYYNQLDDLYVEIYRRLSNLNSTDDRAQEFQQRCRDRGVPVEAIGRVVSVQATRVVGQGSAFMRKQSLDTLWATLAPSLPEDGRDNLISDLIAAEAGQSAVERYYPKKSVNKLASDQQAEAMIWVSVMKTGAMPVITSSQNPVTYATTFLSAAMQAVQSLKQGASPMEVLKFLEVVGPAIGAYIKRFANDPTRAQLAKALDKQWQQLAAVTDQLKQKMQQQAQAQQGQQQKTQAAMTDAQIQTAKAQNDIQIKNVKTQAQLQQSDQKHHQKLVQSAQDMALKDAQTAAEIHRQNQAHQAEMEAKASEPAAAE